MEENVTKPKKGFAAMTPERRKEIASMGGKAAHLSGNAHEFTPLEGRRASLSRKKVKK